MGVLKILEQQDTEMKQERAFKRFVCDICIYILTKLYIISFCIYLWFFFKFFRYVIMVRIIYRQHFLVPKCLLLLILHLMRDSS